MHSTVSVEEIIWWYHAPFGHYEALESTNWKLQLRKMVVQRRARPHDGASGLNQTTENWQILSNTEDVAINLTSASHKSKNNMRHDTVVLYVLYFQMITEIWVESNRNKLDLKLQSKRFLKEREFLRFILVNLDHVLTLFPRSQTQISL